MNLRQQLLAGAGFAILAACTHTIRIEPSDKPIKIDLNITQEVRIILDKQVEDLIADNPDLF
jgi:hypothetical protein